MKKIGFIDYFLDEWHANNYPQWIKEASNGEMEVAYAYAMIDSPRPGGLTSAQWCERFNVTLCESIREVVEHSDYLIVLSPDNCEFHEALCQVPLRSGKPTYVDKTFAPDGATAERIFAVAAAFGTPCFSSSALRYADEYAFTDPSIRAISSVGPNQIETYSIHQLEPIMMLMKAPLRRALCTEGEGWTGITMEFADGRPATMACYWDGSPFMLNIASAQGNKVLTAQSDFFKTFIKEMVRFFETGVAPVAAEETIRIMKAREIIVRATKQPGVWTEA